ncbi:DUF4097 family beta strand repeat-containing protein [Kutzneria sp. CA-103260]|uniref:DUF4097 family beta strand repeat-containing protein n=1 Tax=Kutzneria sp. CA-103260 TaxID=2802641 RepID=UPI001BA999CA|nr:DUF4097 family beta strand repeat-containing protein [Kutzneria sp. CA-103260]QUQ70054.1 Putative adhesin [Kutzneria sp. CA-103260]
MPSFETSEPISVIVELGVGNVRVVASDRADTVVDVRPTDPTDESDAQAAQKITVDYANGVLNVTGQKIRMFDFSKKTRSVDVSIELPSGSKVSVENQIGDFQTAGRLGECGFKSSTGNARLERTAALRLHTSAGHVTVEDVEGNAEIHTSTGRVHVGAVEGSLVVKNSNGETEIGSVGGDTRVRAANGGIAVERAGASVDAKTSNGSIRLGEVARGSVTAATSMGDLEIGIAAGTAAWLEVHTGFGQVRNELTDAARPEQSDETVEVRANTSFGAITIRRA